MKPNMNIDLTSEESQERAGSAFHTVPLTGKHIATIKQAYLTYTNGGSCWINMTLELENGKTYKLPQKCITSGKEKNFEKLHDYDVLLNIMYLTRASGNVGETKIAVTKFENGNKIETEEIFDSYNDLIDKQVGVVIKYYQKYPETFAINGYTGRPIPDRLSDKDGYDKTKSLPTTIWMPNYSKEPQPIFDALIYFDPETEKTWNELKNDVEVPNEVQKILDKLTKHNPDAIKKVGKEWDKMRKNKLRYSLKRNGDEFDESKFIVSQNCDEDAFEPNIEYEMNYDDAM